MGAEVSAYEPGVQHAVAGEMTVARRGDVPPGVIQTPKPEKRACPAAKLGQNRVWYERAYLSQPGRDCGHLPRVFRGRHTRAKQRVVGCPERPVRSVDILQRARHLLACCCPDVILSTGMLGVGQLSIGTTRN